MQILLCASLKALHMQYIEEPTSSWEDSLQFYQETGVPIALDESLDTGMQAPQVWHVHQTPLCFACKTVLWLLLSDS